MLWGSQSPYCAVSTGQLRTSANRRDELINSTLPRDCQSLDCPLAVGEAHQAQERQILCQLEEHGSQGWKGGVVGTGRRNTTGLENSEVMGVQALRPGPAEKSARATIGNMEDEQSLALGGRLQVQQTPGPASAAPPGTRFSQRFLFLSCLSTVRRWHPVGERLWNLSTGFKSQSWIWTRRSDTCAWGLFPHW